MKLGILDLVSKPGASRGAKEGRMVQVLVRVRVRVWVLNPSTRRKMEKGQ
jgi:hypothetical protein